MKRKKSRLNRPNSRNKKTFTDILVTVATVVHNDEDILIEFLQDLHKVLHTQTKYYESLVVDNGSTNTFREELSRLQKRLPNIRVLILSRKYDHEVALRAALENSIGDYVVLLDVASDPPALIPKLVKTAQRGFDVVVAKQRLKGNARFLPDTSYFRIINRQTVTAMTMSKDPYLKSSYGLVGFTRATIPYTPIFRRKSDRYSSLFRLVYTWIVQTFTIAPMLRLSTWLGVSAAFINIAVIIYMFHSKGQVETSIIIFNSFMFFSIFILLGVLTCAIERLLSNPGDEKNYHIAEELNSSIVAESNGVNVV
jgi:glycosyltransferase involved in cell wall biosynthesis